MKAINIKKNDIQWQAKITLKSGSYIIVLLDGIKPSVQDGDIAEISPARVLYCERHSGRE